MRGSRQIIQKRQLGADTNQVAGTELLAYTVPAGVNSVLTNSLAIEVTNGAQVRLAITPNGGSKRTIDDAIAVTTDTLKQIHLAEGDKVAFDVAVQASSTTWDLFLSIEEHI